MKTIIHFTTFFAPLLPEVRSRTNSLDYYDGYPSNLNSFELAREVWPVIHPLVREANQRRIR